MRKIDMLLLASLWLGSFASLQAQSVDFLEDTGRMMELDRRPTQPSPDPVRPPVPPAPVAPVPTPAPTPVVETVPTLEPTPVVETVSDPVQTKAIKEKKAKTDSNHTFSFHGAVDLWFWMDNDFAWGLALGGDKYFLGRSDVPTYLSLGYDYKESLGLVASVGWGGGRAVKGGIPTDFNTFINDYDVDTNAGMSYYSKFFGVHIHSLYAYIDPLGLAGVNSPVGFRFTGGILPHESGMDSSHFMAGNYGGLDFGFDTGDIMQSDALPGLFGFRADMPIKVSAEATPVVLSVLGGLGGFSEYTDPFISLADRGSESKPWSVLAEVSSQGAKINDVFDIDWNLYYWYYNAPSKVQDWNDKSTYIPIDRLNRDSHAMGFTLGTKAQNNGPIYIGMGLALDYLILGSGLGWRTVTDASGQVVYQPVWTSDLAAVGDDFVPKYEHRLNVGVGFSVGMDHMFSLHFAFNHQSNDNSSAFNRRNFLQVDDVTGEEISAEAKQWLAVRLNLDMIKNIQIYMGFAYSLTMSSIQGSPYRPMSIDAGVEYSPISNITLHAGWQMGSTEIGSIWAVEPSLHGAFYLRGRFTF